MKTISRVISSAVMLLISALLCAAAWKLPQLIAPWYTGLSANALSVIGAVTAVFPFPLWEAIAVLLIVWAVASLIHDLKKKKPLRWVTGVLWGVSFAVLLFVVLWGAGHFLPTKTEQIVSVRAPSEDRLANAAAFYGTRASAFANLVPRDEEGMLSVDDLTELSRASDGGFAALAAQYDCLEDTEVTVKPLLPGDLFSYAGTTGIFVAYTAEPCFNPNTYGFAMPFTICHERAHRLGANTEADANFIAYLACASSSDLRYRYSGEFSAFMYCYNALYKLSPERAAEVWNASLSAQVQQDLLGATEHYAPYEGGVKDTAQQVNDLYLKVFAQSEGVGAYEKVSDALAAWYAEQITG